MIGIGRLKCVRMTETVETVHIATTFLIPMVKTMGYPTKTIYLAHGFNRGFILP